MNTKLAFSLSQNIDCENLCKKIQKLIERAKHDNMNISELVLVVSLQQSYEYTKNLYLRIGDNK